jgi:hypothetical protein
VVAVTAAVLSCATVGALAATPSTLRVSLTNSDGQGNSDSATYGSTHALSSNGRYVVFTSDASNLVPGDTNGTVDVFVRDRQARTTRRVSLSSTGTQANGPSFTPVISADGRYVEFMSQATNLVPGGTTVVSNMFVRDLQKGTTRQVNVSSSGIPGNADAITGLAISDNDRYVTFASSASNLAPSGTGQNDAYEHDLTTGTTQRVSVSTGGGEPDYGSGSSGVAISSDGRYIAFGSFASNLVTPAQANFQEEVYVRDMTTGVTRWVSVARNGRQGNANSGGVFNGVSMSADGRFIAFDSDASDLVQNDTNGRFDVFVRDMTDGKTRRVSISSQGHQGNGDSGFDGVAISGDGTTVAFDSVASNLVAGDTNKTGDVFVRDLGRGTTSRVSVTSNGGQANDSSDFASLSLHGSVVAFESVASNLVRKDTNKTTDVFVRGPLR